VEAEEGKQRRAPVASVGEDAEVDVGVGGVQVLESEASGRMGEVGVIVAVPGEDTGLDPVEGVATREVGGGPYVWRSD
jgi:hypothetical protein